MHLYLLHGNHSFARKRAKNELLSSCTAKGFSIASFTVPADLGVKNGVFDQIRQKLTGDSLFAQNEVVSVNFMAADKARGRKPSDGGIRPDFLIPYLAKIPPNIILIIEIPVVLAVKSDLFKKFKKLGGDIRLFKLPPLKDRSALLDETKKFLAKEKVSIDNYTIQKIISNAQGDWWHVFSSLEQTVLLSRAAPQEDINGLLDFQEDQSIFLIFDAIGRGDRAAALRLLYENSSKVNLKSGKDMEQTLGFISLMARQLRQMIAVKSGVNPTDAQREWQVPVFAYGKLKSQTSQFSLDFLCQAYEKLAELQEKAKRGLYSPLSLIDFYILYLISHRAQAGNPV